MARIRTDFWQDEELARLEPLDADSISEADSKRLAGWGIDGSAVVPHYARDRWVYFAQGSDLGPIKIGHTRRVRWRALELQIGYPFGELLFVGLMLGPPATEREMHRRFSHLHIRDEWFRPGHELVEFVRTLSRGGW